MGVGGGGGGGRGVSPPSSSSTSDNRYRRHVIFLRHGEEDGGEEEGDREEQQADDKLDFDDGDFGGFVLRGWLTSPLSQRFFTVFLFFRQVSRRERKSTAAVPPHPTIRIPPSPPSTSGDPRRSRSPASSTWSPWADIFMKKKIAVILHLCTVSSTNWCK